MISKRVVSEPRETYEIGAEALLALIAQQKPDTVKVFNLLRELHRLVAAKGKEQPHLIPIGERAEAIRRAFEERQINSRQALEELDALVHQLQEAQEKREESDLSPEAYAVAWWLRVQKGLDEAQAQQIAEQMEAAFQKFPHWVTSARQEGELRQAMYKVLIGANVPAGDMVTWTDQILTLLRRAGE